MCIPLLHQLLREKQLITMLINQYWDIEDVFTVLLAASSQYPIELLKLKYVSKEKYIS